MENTYLNSKVRKFFGATIVATALLRSGGTLIAVEADAKMDVPAGIASSDWQGIRAAYEVGRHAIVELPSGDFAARNPGQRWRTEFDRTGFVTAPQDGSWTWGLELRAVGGERLEGAESGKADENRLAFARSAEVIEWFVNRASGLQQGWTIVERPEVESGGLALELGVRGDLRPKVSATSVDFVDSSDSVMLTYGGLLAWDADGRKLPVEFAALEDGVAIRVDDREARYPVTIDPLAQQAFLKGSNSAANDLFGEAVAISGETVVVGAPQEDSDAIMVDGDQSNDLASNSGAVYVFVRSGGLWAQQAYLKASNTGANDEFGGAVAISGDIIVIGARQEDGSDVDVDGLDDNLAANSGAAYVFERVAGVWGFAAYLKASNTGAGDNFGTSVAVDGETAIVGARFEDSASIGVNAGGADTGNNTGAAYVFARTGGVWDAQAYLKASNTGDDDRFGISVGISGDTAVVGARFEDTTADDSGGAYTFERTGVNWLPGIFLKAPNAGADDEFGTSVAISGDTIVIGAPNEDSSASGISGSQSDGANNAGAGYVFVRSGAAWPLQAYLKAFTNGINGVGNEFGGSVAISGDVIVIGAEFEDSGSTGVNGSEVNFGATSSGAAFAFVRSGVTWSRLAYLKSSNSGADDRFGSAVSVSGTTAVAGARLEDTFAFGVNTGANNSLSASSGASYIFDLTPVAEVPSNNGGGGGGGEGGGAGGGGGAVTVDNLRPELRVRGRKTIETKRKRVVIRGTAKDASGIRRLVVKAKGAKVVKERLKSGNRWKTVLRVRKSRGRVIVNIQAVDNAGNTSKRSRVRIIRR